MSMTVSWNRLVFFVTHHATAIFKDMTLTWNKKKILNYIMLIISSLGLTYKLNFWLTVKDFLNLKVTEQIN